MQKHSKSIQYAKAKQLICRSKEKGIVEELKDFFVEEKGWAVELYWFIVR